MKKNVCALMAFVMLCMSAGNVLTAETKSADSALTKGFSEFTLDEDLSWLEGTWKLTSWKTDNHGKIENSTDKYTYKHLKIRGKEKQSTLIEETLGRNTNSGQAFEYTVEKYLLMNSHLTGNKNLVNDKKTRLLLVREFARDPEVIFYYTYAKQKTKKYEDAVEHVREEVIGGTRETIRVNHKQVMANLKEMDESLRASHPVTASKNLEKFLEKANNIIETYEKNKNNKLEYAQYNKIYSNYRECLKYWNKEQKLLNK